MNIIIAQVLGIVFTVLGLSLLINKKMGKLVEETIRNEGMLWLWGFICLVMGSVLVVLQNTWNSGLETLMSIVGWLILLKGLLILFCPHWMVSMYKKWSGDAVLTFGGLIAFILGLLLMYKGFM